MQIETGHWPKHPTLSGWLLKDKRFAEHRIVCVDGQEPYSIISDNGQRWTAKGEMHANGTPSVHDLIIPPDPYEHLRAAFNAGQKIQYNFGGLVEDWGDIEEEPDWKEPAARFRVKPQPSMVPLGPDDVPPFSLIRKTGESDSWHWRLISYVTAVQMVCADRGYPFKEIQRTHEINRSLSQTGKFDPTSWEKCEKPAT